MTKLLIALACLSVVSAATAQTTSPRDGKVTPSTNDATGRKSTFGMNADGDPATGTGLHGGPTSDTYKWWLKKEGLKDEPKTK